MTDIPYLQYTKTKGTIYYRYLLPDGSYEGLGTDKIRAEQVARELNVIRAEKEARSIKISRVLDEFLPVKMRTSKSKATKDIWGMRIRKYHEWLGHKDVASITVRELDELLLSVAPDFEPYRCHRLLLTEVFAFAIGKGWREHFAGNPAKALLPPKLARQRVVKQRQRMTMAQFDAVHSAAPEWLQLGMDLMLLIGIRRGDLCRLKVGDFRDGWLYFIPSKTADLPTPAAIKIRITDELQVLLNRSIALKPQGEYFIRKLNSFARTGPSVERGDRTQVLPEQFGRHFRTARLKVGWAFKGLADKECPTAHEIRSLCSRIKRDAGWDLSKVQLLLGHADEGMTQYYQSGDKILWQEIEL